MNRLPARARTWTLTIPAPVKVTKTGYRSALWLNENVRFMHWSRKSQLVKAWRLVARNEATRAAIPPLERAHIIAYVHRSRGGRFDPTNWAPTAKAAIDGIVDARVLEDDDHHHLIGPDMRAGEVRDEPCLVLVIKEIKAP